MNQQTSRRLDRWVGTVLCAALTLWRRLVERRSAQGAAPRKILFLKLAEMGAIVLAMPAFEAARRLVGRENLYIALLAGNEEVHEILPVFDPSRRVVLRDRNLWTMALDVWRLMRFCRRQGIDTVIDLEGFARISALLSYLTGARHRVGWHRYTTEGPYRGDLFTHRVAHNAYLHASVQFLTLVEALSEPPGQEPLVKRAIALGNYELPRLELREAERQAAAHLVGRVSGGAATRPWVLLNPNLIDLLPLRRWPEENYLLLGRRLLAEHPGATLLLTGLPAERERSRQLARQISPERCFSLAGETPTLRSLIALYDQAALLVTSDSGPAHLAAVSGVPIVSLFGPETPQLYAPLSPRNRSLWAALACSPCLSALNHRASACQDNVCLRAITVDQVLEACRQMCGELRSEGAAAPARADESVDRGSARP